ncbi:MAG: chemotaxis protein CheA [Pseudomonas sp.]|uniref:chemotaxis protein CheA n=1 Tax=Pseudomonas sp. TaxID=306 RepID=UPI002715DC54|nr:chemotaxis protein CheA [Pseudomonas sp.]MDO9618676.1 chemotaxis protein CheA [Pseudomonas sp.]MDP2447545.1 chemotaxis protein CheA [Pseudomonas sp.]MDZ4335642.1 chemotaxis protein CheA [Pseudomonas sp.]
MNLDQARGALVQEARELLVDMENALLEIESDGYNAERVNAIFRAAHTIKGSAGLFGLESLINFTHVVESLLDQVRNGEKSLDGSMLSLLLTCGDYIGSLITAVEDRSEVIDPNPELRAHLISQLNEYLEQGIEPVAAPALPEQTQLSQVPSGKVDVLTGEEVGSDLWHISLRPNNDVLRNGMDPLSFLRYLSKLGRIVYLHTLTDTLPQAEAFDAESNYLGFEIEFESQASKQEVEDAFEFIREDSQLLILPPHSKIEAYLNLIVSLPESPRKLGEILLKSGALTAHELQRVLALQSAAPQPAPPLGTLLVEEQLVAPPLVSAALSKQKQADDKRVHEQVFIKVEVGKLDELINLVGELVIAGAAASLSLRQGNPAAMGEANEAVANLVEHIRDASLSLRMVAIGEVFQRFPRVVRDISKELDKDIELLITGADTELDKSMVEKLADPLMHIVRNAMDHGIERSVDRLAAGKTQRGALRLNAYHESGSIVIEVTDDGRGLDRPRILAKALEKGLVQPDQVLSDSEVFRLIFEAGFSTAETVTNLSGRGVGMDVVRSNIEKLRGEVEVLSVFGQGTTVRIRLPLTLAIIDGFQVRVADEAFVLPLDQVVECVDLGPQVELHDLLNLRGEPLPYVRLRNLFGLPPSVGARESLVVLQYGSSRAGVVVDQLIGEFQAVIKPLGQIFAQNKVLSGSTILGDGSVALILDVPNLIQRACTAAENTTSPAVQRAAITH